MTTAQRLSGSTAVCKDTDGVRRQEWFAFAEWFLLNLTHLLHAGDGLVLPEESEMRVEQGLAQMHGVTKAGMFVDFAQAVSGT